jgi:SHS family lactate transporter-like MFS transporter
MAETHDGEHGAFDFEVDQTEESMGTREYLATRFSTLKPPMHRAPNPFKALALLNRQQWLFFLVNGLVKN